VGTKQNAHQKSWHAAEEPKFNVFHKKNKQTKKRRFFFSGSPLETETKGTEPSSRGARRKLFPTEQHNKSSKGEVLKILLILIQYAQIGF